MTKYLMLFLLTLPIYSISFSQSIYDYSLLSTGGDTIHLSDFNGKKILFVNTAGSSLLAYQYQKLEQLNQLYHDSLVIIAVPSNSFGNEQETDSAINENVHNTYGITYKLAATTEVAGDSINLVYQWLTKQNLNGFIENPITTDFQKFLVGIDGHIIGVFSSKVDPLSDELQNAVKSIDE